MSPEPGCPRNQGTKWDRYGRIIARCYDLHGADIRENMVWIGRALAFRRYSMEYAGAEKQAKDAKRAMLKGEFVEPWEWRKQRRR